MKQILTYLFAFTVVALHGFAQPDQAVVHTITGNFHKIIRFESDYLPTKRDVIVWLPPSYDLKPEKRFPVFYLHDGQNVFDGATAFVEGSEWRADETADSLIRLGTIPEIIMVAVYNAGPERMKEYTPMRDSVYGGGDADDYAKFLVEEIKPLIDSEYRTIPDADYTGLGGSSLGGLVSLYIALKYPDVFGKIAVMSPSVWWANRSILQQVIQLPKKFPLRIWVDVGDSEDINGMMLRDAKILVDKLESKGWRQGVDLGFMIGKGEKHDEAAWASRLSHVMFFLWGDVEE